LTDCGGVEAGEELPAVVWLGVENADEVTRERSGDSDRSYSDCSPTKVEPSPSEMGEYEKDSVTDDNRLLSGEAFIGADTDRDGDEYADESDGDGDALVCPMTDSIPISVHIKLSASSEIGPATQYWPIKGNAINKRVIRKNRVL
jgi:hypothetical protein